jgi:hypothetical protein
MPRGSSRRIEVGQVALALVAILVTTAVPARSQSGGVYRMSGSSFGGGGGASTGAAYAIRGSAAQAGVGAIAGGAYKLTAGFWRGEITTTGVPPADAGVPVSFRLYPGHPNPFVTGTTFAFDLPQDTRVRVAIFDVAGHQVRQLLDSPQHAGRVQLHWNATDDDGRPAPAGVYFARFQAGRHVATSKVVLLSEGGAR